MPNQELHDHMKRLGIVWDPDMPRLPLNTGRGYGMYLIPDGPVIGETLDDVRRKLHERVPAQEPCHLPMPHPDGTGRCIRCGWQHASRGRNAVEENA